MRKSKMTGLSAMAALSLMASVGVSAGSAATWDPQGTAITATNVGNVVLDDNAGHHITCTTSTVNLRATGSVATASPSPSFTGCSNDVIGGATTVTTGATWSFDAVSTTNVTATVSSGTAATISLAGGICTITVPGPITIPNNSWTNASHQLHISTATSFALNQSAGCFGAVGSRGVLTATYRLPTSAVIT